MQIFLGFLGESAMTTDWGEDEAPPAIISVFIGSQLEDLLNQIMNNGEITGSEERVKINVGVHSIPELYKDLCRQKPYFSICIYR